MEESDYSDSVSDPLCSWVIRRLLRESGFEATMRDIYQNAIHGLPPDVREVVMAQVHREIKSRGTELETARKLRYDGRPVEPRGGEQ